jgi:outer membrane protein assembly factor BamD (BamD/ComL family)
LDYVAAQNWDQAGRSLERFLKDFPESPLQDQALCGLLIANMKQGNRAEGEKAALRSQAQVPPLSHATEIASRVLADAK